MGKKEWVQSQESSQGQEGEHELRRVVACCVGSSSQIDRQSMRRYEKREREREGDMKIKRSYIRAMSDVRCKAGQ